MGMWQTCRHLQTPSTALSLACRDTRKPAHSVSVSFQYIPLHLRCDPFKYHSHQFNLNYTMRVCMCAWLRVCKVCKQFFRYTLTVWILTLLKIWKTLLIYTASWMHNATWPIDVSLIHRHVSHVSGITNTRTSNCESWPMHTHVGHDWCSDVRRMTNAQTCGVWPMDRQVIPEPFVKHNIALCGPPHTCMYEDCFYCFS